MIIITYMYTLLVIVNTLNTIFILTVKIPIIVLYELVVQDLKETSSQLKLQNC